MKCRKCKKSKTCIKRGKRNGIQRFYCKNCNLFQQSFYKYQLYDRKFDRLIRFWVKDGASISGLHRRIKVSRQTIQRQIIRIAKEIKYPFIREVNQVYELDEMCTYIGKNVPENRVYITYAINRKTRKVIDFVVGSRTIREISKVINSLKLLSPKRIITDKLNLYPNLVAPITHSTRPYSNNHIERSNLTLRTNLRRLQRKTICYSKSVAMLAACLKIYFWG